ncbi:MAG: hypothetical protein WC376_05965 [Candidatus Nanoarchaeia archaeon]|jgi:hypothetical protein
MPNNGELEIKGLEQLNKLVVEFKGNLEAVLGVMINDVKATEASNNAKLTEAKTLQVLNKTAIEQQKSEEQSALNKLKIEKAALSLKKATEQLTAEQKLLQKINESETGSYNQLSAQMSLNQIRLKAMSEETRKNTKAGQELEKETNDLNNKLKDLDKTVGVSTRDVGDYGIAAKSMKLGLRENTIALAKMKAAGEDNTETYVKLLKVTGELSDTIADTREEIKRYASDTQGLDMAIGVFKGLGSAAQVAEGATALLGNENEDLTKSIQKMVAIQSVMTGVQEIGNALQKESSFMMGLMAAKTNIASAAQAIYTFAVGASTGALKAFRIAMLATGIGALIVGLGLLIANFEKVKNAIFGGNDELERFGKLTEKYNLVADIKNKKIKDEIDLLKAKGATDDEIAKKEREMMLNGIAATEAKIAENKKLQESAKGDQLLGLKNQENALNNSLREQDRLLLVFDETNKTRRAKEIEEEKKKNKKKDETQKESIEITRQNTKSDYEVRLENQKEGDKLMQEAILKGKQEAWEITKETIQENYDEEINMLNEQYVKEIESAQGNEEQIKQINDNYNLMMQVAEIDKWTAILATAQKGSQDEKNALIALSELKKSIAITTANTEIEAQRDLKEKEFEILRLRRAAMIQFGEGVGSATALFLMNQEDAARQSLKNMVRAALQALKAYAYIQLGITTVGSMASAESIATWGIAGAIKAAALAALIEGAVTVAEAGSNSLIDQFAKGTKDAPGGAAILGEGKGIYAGHELVTLPDGTKFLTPDHATFYPNLPEHSVVTAAPFVNEELRKSFENSQLSKNDNKFMSDHLLRDMNKKLGKIENKKTSIILNVSGASMPFVKMVNERYRK